MSTNRFQPVPEEERRQNRGDPFRYGKKKYTAHERQEVLKARSKSNRKYGTESVVGAGAAISQAISPSMKKAIDSLVRNESLSLLSQQEKIEKYSGRVFGTFHEASQFVQQLTGEKIYDDQYKKISKNGYELRHNKTRYEIHARRAKYKLIITTSRR
jgi:hypothetical protein